MEQSEAVQHLKGGQISSQTRWDKVRLFSTSMVSDIFTNAMGQSDSLVPQGLSDNFTNTMGQSETV